MVENHPGEGVVKEEKFLNTRKPSHWLVCGEVQTLRGKHNREEKNPTDYAPNHNSQQRSSPDTRSATSKWGLGREARAALLRVRTGPECPEGNLRELTWDSQAVG